MQSFDFKKLTDDQVITQTQRLVSEERRITTELLWHLREVEARMIYAIRGYPSLFEYCTKGLGYSEGAAGRRISAMRLLKEMPAPVAQALQSGQVSLSSAAAVQVFLQREKREQGKTYSPEQKSALFQQIQGKSQRETEKLLMELSPQSVQQDREKVLSPTQTEIRFVASESLMQKLKQLRDLASNQTQTGSYNELFELMADSLIRELEKKTAIRTQSQVTPAPESAPTRYIPAPTRRQIWSRDHGRCTYRDPKTGRSCQSRYRLQIDHIQPFAKGGLNTIENLRLRCFAHNRLWAIQSYGNTKINRMAPSTAG